MSKSSILSKPYWEMSGVADKGAVNIVVTLIRMSRGVYREE